MLLDIDGKYTEILRKNCKINWKYTTKKNQENVIFNTGTLKKQKWHLQVTT